MKVNCCSTYVSLALLAVLSLIFLASSVESKAITTDTAAEDSHHIQKRNAWWSKKSDTSNAQLGRELWQEKRDNRNTDVMDENDSSSEDVSEGLKCYSDACVPEFVLCIRQAVHNDGLYIACKLEHRLCAAQCFTGNAANGIPI